MPRLPKPFNDKDQEILDYIIRYKAANDGVAPSRREIVANCSPGSTSEASRLLGRLQKFGFIQIDPDDPRVIRVDGGKWTFEGSQRPPLEVVACPWPLEGACASGDG